MSVDQGTDIARACGKVLVVGRVGSDAVAQGGASRVIQA